MSEIYNLSTYYLGPDENSLLFNVTCRKNPFSSEWSRKKEKYIPYTMKTVSGMYCDFLKQDEKSIFNIVEKKRRNRNTMKLPKHQKDRYEDTYVYFSKNNTCF